MPSDSPATPCEMNFNFTFNTPAGPTELDELVNRATDRLRTSPDWAENLEICDIITQGGERAIADACRAIRRRMCDKSANVALLALTLLETCMKNCPEAFHDQVAAKDFQSDITRLATGRGEVAAKALSLVEMWADAFQSEGHPQFGQTYASLRSKGVRARTPLPPPRRQHTKGWSAPALPAPQRLMARSRRRLAHRAAARASGACRCSSRRATWAPPRRSSRRRPPRPPRSPPALSSRRAARVSSERRRCLCKTCARRMRSSRRRRRRTGIGRSASSPATRPSLQTTTTTTTTTTTVPTLSARGRTRGTRRKAARASTRARRRLPRCGAPTRQWSRSSPRSPTRPIYALTSPRWRTTQRCCAIA